MFAWTFIDGSGEEVGRSQRFSDADAAEDWMGNCWQDLLENGVEEVVLYDHTHDHRMYRMGLGAEKPGSSSRGASQEIESGPSARTFST